MRETRGERKVVNEKIIQSVIRSSSNLQEGLENSNAEKMVSSIKPPEGDSQVMPQSVEFTREKPVIKEIIVEVPYEVIIEKPVENRIEKEVVVEKVVEIPVERVIEREVEMIERVERVNVIEKPIYTEKVVDNVVEKIVEVPVEVPVEQKVEVIEQVPVHVERRVARPFRMQKKGEGVEREGTTSQVEEVKRTVPGQVNRFVDVEVEEIREVYRDVPKEKVFYIEKYVDKPVEKVVVIEEEQEEIVKEVVDREVIVEKEVYEDVIRKVQKPVLRKVQVVVDKEVIVPKEEVVEVPQFRDRVVEMETVVEVPKERVVQVEKVVDQVEEVEVPQTITKEIIKEHEVETPIYRKVAKYVEVPFEKVVEKVVEKNVDIRVEKEVTKVVKVDKVVPIERVKEVFVEVPYEKRVEKEYEVEVFKQVPVYRDKVVQKKVEKVVEKKVFVPFKKYVQVPVEKIVEKKIETEIISENPIYVEVDQEEEQIVRKSATNERLRKSWSSNQKKIHKLSQERTDLRNKLQKVRKGRSQKKSEVVKEEVVGQDENQKLREELDKMHKELTTLIEGVQRSHIREEVHSNVKQSTRAREIDRQEMESLVRESTLGERVVESEVKQSAMGNSYLVNTNGQTTEKNGEAQYKVESTPSGRLIKKLLNDSSDQRGSVKTYKKQMQTVPTKSENRFYRLDEHGNKQYVSVSEQKELEKFERTSINRSTSPFRVV